MSELFDRILDVIRKYRINAVYYINDLCYTQDEVTRIQRQQLELYASSLSAYKSVALYGGGRFCKEVFASLSKLNNITCIIDSSASKQKTSMGFPLVDLDEFLLNYESTTDAVIITSWDYHEAFKSQLQLVNCHGAIIDLPQWMMEQFPDFGRPIYEYTGRINYIQINDLELLYQQAVGIIKYRTLRKIIYALCMVKDFLYAEKYICEMERLFPALGGTDYRKAINEIKSIMEACAKQKGSDVLFIHVVDSLSDFIVDDMPWLSAHSRNGIRFRGITVQYPYTHYSMNTIFTGKSAFTIELSTENIEWEDSELLRFIKEKYSVNLISANSHVLQEFQKINDNTEADCPSMLSEMLFEGLSLWNRKNNRNIIFIHSCGEFHAPYYSIGSGSKLVLCGDMTLKLQFEQQRQNAVYYADQELKWYDYFYSLTGMPMIIMGDHGSSLEEAYNYFLGIKRDLTRGMEETLSSAFIINRLGEEHGEIYGLIPNSKIPHIINAVLENKTEPLKNMSVDTVELEFPPGYQETYCKNFMSRGIWGQYEGFIGIRTRLEIYLVSASGRELYFRPREWKYRNLVGNDAYKEDVERCRKKLGNKKFPVDIFAMEKYKRHLELLKLYDNKCYLRIVESLRKTTQTI